MRIVLTGASGQLGRVVAADLQAHGHTVVPISLRAGQPVPSITADTEAVIHLGAQTNAYVAREDLSQDVRANVVTFVDLLEALKGLDRPPRLILTGSVTQSLGIQEHSPSTFYDVAKSASQLYLEQAVREGWVSVGATLRLSNVYGGASAPNHAYPRGFLNLCIERALAGEPITVYGTGEQLRDYVHVDDVAECIRRVLESADFERRSLALDVGCGVGFRLIDAIALVIEIAYETTGLRSTVSFASWPVDAYEIEWRSTVVDVAGLRDLLGWVPQVDLETGIRRAIAFR